MYDQIDFRFRYQVAVNSLHATLLKYLQSKDTEFAREQMIVWSLSAFWHPLACRWIGSFTEAELKVKARNAIYQLQQQINYLAQNFGLDPQELGSVVAHAQLNGSVKKLATADPPVTSFTPQVESNSSIAVAGESSSSQSSTIATKDTPTTSNLLVRQENDRELDELFDR